MSRKSPRPPRIQRTREPADGLVAVGLARRLAAIFYDALLLFSTVFVAALIAVVIHGGAIPGGLANPFFSSYLFIITALYFCWPWVRSGQTLGMKTWKIRLVTLDGHPVGWWHALLRFLSSWVSWAAAGGGFWWQLVDRHGLTWHDRFSLSVVIDERHSAPSAYPSHQQQGDAEQ